MSAISTTRCVCSEVTNCLARLRETCSQNIHTNNVAFGVFFIRLPRSCLPYLGANHRAVFFQGTLEQQNLLVDILHRPAELAQKRVLGCLKRKTYHNHIIYIPPPSTQQNLLWLFCRPENVYVYSFINLNDKIVQFCKFQLRYTLCIYSWLGSVTCKCLKWTNLRSFLLQIK